MLIKYIMYQNNAEVAPFFFLSLGTEKLGGGAQPPLLTNEETQAPFAPTFSHH